jgi:hypothetical protein
MHDIRQITCSHYSNNMSYQLDFFEPNDVEHFLKRDIEHVQEQVNNVRRGLFARHNELVKMFLKQQDEIDRLRDMLIQARK